MSRDDGFAVMDVSTSILDDEKFKKLARYSPDHIGTAVTGFLATLSASWRHAKRVQIEDAWPAFMPFDRLAADALIHCKLLDKTGRIPAKPWNGWFGPARKRREVTRDRWDRYNAKRRGTSTNDDAATALAPRGNDAVTATPVRQSVSPSVRQLNKASDSHDRRPIGPVEQMGRTA